MVKYANFNTNMGKFHEAITVAYHEAGHVLIALLSYSKIVSAFLSSEEKDIIGLTEYDLFLDFDDTEDYNLSKYLINSYICINYAGMLAEKINLKKMTGTDIFPKSFKNGCYVDLEEINNIINKYKLCENGKSKTVFKNKMMKKTTQLLEYYWDDLVLIAHAIYKNKISHKDLKKVLLKSENKEFWKEQFKKINFIHKNKYPSGFNIKAYLEI